MKQLEEGTLMLVVRPSELGAMIRRELKAVLADQTQPELMTTAQLAKAFDVSQDLVRLWVREQGCPHIRAGQKKLRYRLADVIAWLEKRDA